MKKKNYYLMWIMMVALTVCMFTACGDDKDDDLPEGYYMTTEGIHRIEVSFNGDLTGWDGEMTFIAVYADGTHGNVRLYENGQLVADNGGYRIEALRNCAIETDAKCDQMSLGLIMEHSSSKSVSSITVTLKSLINGQQKKMKVVDFPASESYKSIIFNAELDADIL